MYAKFALSCYKEILSAAGTNPEAIGDSIPMPRFDENFVLKLVAEAKEVLMEDRPVVHTAGDLVVVGDIHGNFHDMMRIFAKNGMPPERKYLFLGDYVDRGEFSLDVIFFLYVLKINFPEKIILIRGNHEFPSVNKIYGFLGSIMKVYQNEAVWEAFNDSFNYLPVVAIINNAIFCVHGGISNLVMLDSLNELSFPITKSSNLIDDLVWSDPSEGVETFIENQRGRGVKFGSRLLTKFMKVTGMQLIIRAHQCVDGFKRHINDQVLTVFSSSCYGDNNNKCGFAYVDSSLNIKCDKFRALGVKFTLEDASYMQVKFNPDPQESNLPRIGTFMCQFPSTMSISKRCLFSPPHQMNIRRKVTSLPMRVPLEKKSFSSNAIKYLGIQKVSKTPEPLIN